MSRNLKATAVTTGLYAAAFALGILGAMVKPETRIVGTIGTKRVDIPAWLQNEPDYDKKIKNAKVEQGWGGLRLVLWGLAVVPAGLGLALSSERQGELEKERKQYDRECREEDALGEVRSLYKVSLTKAVLQKRGEATIALVEDELEDEVDSIREANGWFAPDVQTPQKAIEPPLLREPEATQTNPFEGMKTPKQYADELEAARQGAIGRLDSNSGDGGAVPAADRVEDDRKKLYQDRGEKIMRSLAALKMSILSAAPTGGGKTHTLYKWLGDLQALYPQNECYVIAHKRDSFLGLLEQGRVKLFNSFNPETSLIYLDQVYAEMERRLHEPEEDRKKFEKMPIRLILDDWFATFDVLKKSYSDIWQIVSIKLGAIITKGREANVCVYIATQSFNIVSLGIQDSNIRGNLAITCQGLVTEKMDDFGEVVEQGNYESLQLLIDNKFIVSSKADRERLNAELEELIALSRLHQVPAMFSAVGKPMLALAPHYEKPKRTIVNEDLGFTNVAVLDRNDGDNEDDQLPEFSGDWEFERDRLEKLLKSDSESDTGNSDTDDKNDLLTTGRAQDDDSIGVPRDNHFNHDENDSSDNSSNSPDYEEADLEYLKWLPNESKLIKILENAEPNFSLSNVVRSKLKVTSSTNAKRAKRSIMALVKKLNRADLWIKFEMDDINLN